MSFPTPAQPSLFLSHGAPNFLLYDSDTRDCWRQLARDVPRPTAILIMSAHFCAAAPCFESAATLSTLHDFSGFEPVLYTKNYPAPGAPALAARALALTEQAGLVGFLSRGRGLDHGAWVPLKIMFPEADIPVLQLSVQPQASAAEHFALGRALAPLRDAGVLIIGSGGVTHNLDAFSISDDDWPPAQIFADWVAARVEDGDAAAICDWTRAPEARENHPTPEHFLPLAFALGAGGGLGRRVHRALVGPMALDAYRFDA